MQDLLIDLDNTIYSEREEIFSQIDLKMKSFISYRIKYNSRKCIHYSKKIFF